MPSAIDMLNSLDVAELEREIANREAALQAVIAEHRQELDALRVLLKASQLKAGTLPARKPAAERSPAQIKPAKENANRNRIHDYVTAAGPTLVSKIAAELSLPVHVVSRLVNHSWFKRGLDERISIA